MTGKGKVVFGQGAIDEFQNLDFKESEEVWFYDGLKMALHTG